MENKVNEILNILKYNDETSKKTILLECAAKIGSKEWEDAVRDLMKRMEELDKNKNRL